MRLPYTGDPLTTFEFRKRWRLPNTDEGSEEGPPYRRGQGPDVLYPQCAGSATELRLDEIDGDGRALR